ncbi:MAG TPA: NfeD family protein [Pyrinomonadaceae bacterium]|nr:NfeD family protein [Pyrinomonadaceae bacterium]
MKLIFLIAILAAAAGIAAALVVALYVHKRRGAGDIKLIGEIARVDTKLDPEGTVIVCGELWRAKSKTEALISAGARVRVVAFVDQLALVELCD